MPEHSVVSFQLSPGPSNATVDYQKINITVATILWSDVHSFQVDIAFLHVYTIKILGIGKDWSGQTVQTLIRLLLKEQSDQGLHC